MGRLYGDNDNLFMPNYKNADIYTSKKLSIPRNNESSGLLINEHQASGDILRWNGLLQAVFQYSIRNLDLETCMGLLVVQSSESEELLEVKQVQTWLRGYLCFL